MCANAWTTCGRNWACKVLYLVSVEWEDAPTLRDACHTSKAAAAALNAHRPRRRLTLATRAEAADSKNG